MIVDVGDVVVVVDFEVEIVEIVVGEDDDAVFSLIISNVTFISMLIIHPFTKITFLRNFFITCRFMSNVIDVIVVYESIMASYSYDIVAKNFQETIFITTVCMNS